MASEEQTSFKSEESDEKKDDPVSRTDADDCDGAYKKQTSLIAETAKAFRGGSNHSVEREDDDEPSQVTLSQTDEHIRLLENDGTLNQVVGSQSMLSQELLCASQPEEDEEPEFSQSQFACSQHTETSICMAQRLGLLTQEDEILPSRDSSSDLQSQTSAQASPAESASSQQPEAAKSVVSFQNDKFSSPTTSATNASVAHSAKPPALRDTPIRESECFGSLLEAVQAITEREEVSAKLYALQYETPSSVAEEEKDSSTSPKSGGSSKRKASAKSDAKSSAPSPKKARKATAKKAKDSEQRNAQEIAKRAAALAEQTVSDPALAKKLLLSMALVRENPRTLPSTWPPRGSVVPEGFFWAHYPPLEGVLKKHMAEYYELSTTKCQSAQQQAFNNELVFLVREVSKEQGWKFNKSFSDKSLRDRIRCYYKTHIQNAKKRLRTMVRNPTKKANARHLCSHLDLIEKYNEVGGSVSGDSEADAPSSPADVKPKPKAAKKSKVTPVSSPAKPRRKVSPASSVKDRRSKVVSKQPVVEV
mmetsp:Transcript_65295/g.98508  ORF Transcript_65295/g.98508 Transcript_65295/m.98508 type:complete len:533 (+) Transcript_65295:109-1707(+)